MNDKSKIIGATTCSNCCFALPATDNNGKIDWGRRFCRGSTPEPLMVGVNPQSGPIIQWIWPVVGAKDWCGVHQPRELEMALPGEAKPEVAEEAKPS